MACSRHVLGPLRGRETSVPSRSTGIRAADGLGIGLSVHDFLGLVGLGGEDLLQTITELLPREELQWGLFRAAGEGHGAAVAMLLSKGADVNTYGGEGQSALLLAVRRLSNLEDDRGLWSQRSDHPRRTKATVEAVRVLLQAGATVNGLPARFHCLLCTFASCGTDEIISLLERRHCRMTPADGHECEAMTSAKP